MYCLRCTDDHFSSQHCSQPACSKSAAKHDCVSMNFQHQSPWPVAFPCNPMHILRPCTQLTDPGMVHAAGSMFMPQHVHQSICTPWTELQLVSVLQRMLNSNLPSTKQEPLETNANRAYACLHGSDSQCMYCVDVQLQQHQQFHRMRQSTFQSSQA